MIKVAKVPKLMIKIIKTLLENCKNNQKISLKNLDFMGESRMISTYKEKVWYRNELKIGVA